MIFDLCNEFKLNEYEILALVRELRSDGINITTKVHDDDLYLFDYGERESNYEYNYELTTDENHEFKFVAISFIFTSGELASILCKASIIGIPADKRTCNSDVNEIF